MSKTIKRYTQLLPRDLRIELTRLIAHSLPIQFLRLENIREFCDNEQDRNDRIFIMINLELYYTYDIDNATISAVMYAIEHVMLDELSEFMYDLDISQRHDIYKLLGGIESKIIPIRIHRLTSWTGANSCGVRSHYLTIYREKSQLNIENLVAKRYTPYNAWRRVCYCQKMLSEALWTQVNVPNIENTINAYAKYFEYCNKCHQNIYVPFCHDPERNVYIDARAYYVEFVVNGLTYVCDETEMPTDLRNMVDPSIRDWKSRP
jgi:hypothetical protein